MGVIVLCTSESGNTHLAPNQGQTCQITIYEKGLNLLNMPKMHEDWRDTDIAQKL